MSVVKIVSGANGKAKQLQEHIDEGTRIASAGRRRPMPGESVQWMADGHYRSVLEKVKADAMKRTYMEVRQEVANLSIWIAKRCEKDQAIRQVFDALHKDEDAAEVEGYNAEPSIRRYCGETKAAFYALPDAEQRRIMGGWEPELERTP